jgi:hypothetical protein
MIDRTRHRLTLHEALRLDGNRQSNGRLHGARPGIVYGENDAGRALHESGKKSRTACRLTYRCHATPGRLPDNGAYCALPKGILQRSDARVGALLPRDRAAIRMKGNGAASL